MNGPITLPSDNLPVIDSESTLTWPLNTTSRGTGGSPLSLGPPGAGRKVPMAV